MPILVILFNVECLRADTTWRLDTRLGRQVESQGSRFQGA
jgi:hypothetical protein